MDITVPGGVREARRLWQASMDGDLVLVRTILGSCPEVEVNWAEGDRMDGPLHRACRFGRTEVARELLGHPAVKVNQLNNRGCNPFFIACQEGSTDIVRMALADSRIDVTWPHAEGHEPFMMACQEGHLDVIFLLLGDPRIDVNKPNLKNGTPLWYAAQRGHLQVVRHLLASDTRIDTARISSFNSRTAAEQARAMVHASRAFDETEEDHQRRIANGPLIADLISEYEKDPGGVRWSLRLLPGLRGAHSPFVDLVDLCVSSDLTSRSNGVDLFIGKVFALVVFFADGFVTERSETPAEVLRFLRVSAKLPLDLQMLLCNRLYGSAREVVSTKVSEEGFLWLARCSNSQL